MARLGGLSFADPVRFRIAGVSITNGDSPESHRGGIFNMGGDLLLEDTLVANNASDLGGGIDTMSGRVKLVRSQVSNNEGRRCCGGIRAIAQARIELDRSAVMANYTTHPQASGAGIYCFRTSELKVTRSALIQNHATGSGGALTFYGARGKIRRSIIQGNRADGGGAGIAMFHTPTPTENMPIPGPLLIQDSQVIENVADADNDGLGGGGGLIVTYETWSAPSPPILQRTTVSGNSDHSGRGPDCVGELRDGGGNTLGNTTNCLLLP